MRLVVTDIVTETQLIKRVRLCQQDGSPLPGFGAGAHVALKIPGIGERKYSLISVATEVGATAAPACYEIGVRLDADGGGGSKFIHALKLGDGLDASGPENAFPLSGAPAPVVLIAGGIGVTPLLTMAAEMTATGRPFRFIYAARTRSELAFVREINALTGNTAMFHVDDEMTAVLDISAILASLNTETSVYSCGPKPMLKAAIKAARNLDWPKDRLRFELFYSGAQTF